MVCLMWFFESILTWHWRIKWTCMTFIEITQQGAIKMFRPLWYIHVHHRNTYINSKFSVITKTAKVWEIFFQVTYNMCFITRLVCALSLIGLYLKTRTDINRGWDLSIPSQTLNLSWAPVWLTFKDSWLDYPAPRSPSLCVAGFIWPPCMFNSYFQIFASFDVLRISF